MTPLFLALALFVPSAVLGQDIFFVSRSTDAGVWDVLQFDTVHTLQGEGYDEDTSVFTAQTDGHYLFTLSAGVTAGSGLDIEIVQSTSVASGIYRTNDNTDGIDTRSRNVILELSAGESVHVTTRTPATSGEEGDDARLISWGGVHLEPLLDQESLSIFSAARTSPQEFNNFILPVSYDVTDFNVGDDYIPSANGFQAPKNCSLFITYTIAHEGGDVARTLLTDPESINPTELRVLDTSKNGIDMLSRTAMMELEMGEFAFVNFLQGAIYSDDRKMISFTGFMFDTEDDSNEIAWSVFRTASLNLGEFPSQVAFPTERTNVGNPWNPLTHRVLIPKSGYYFISLDMSAQTGGGNQRAAVDIDLVRTVDGNDTFIGGVKRSSQVHDESDGLSRSFIYQLDEGDEVWVYANPESGLFSDVDGQCGFSGFLISPTN